MSILKDPSEVVYFVSVLHRQDLVDKSDIDNKLKSFFGEYLEFKNDYFPMKEYYSKEMGPEQALSRYFLVFPLKKKREFLISAKKFCDSMENKSLRDGSRILNVDPGYFSLDQLILSTGKPYSHRVYLEQGIYAELTYRYQGSSYETFDWTYPDYANSQIINFFNWCRNFLFL